MTRQLSRLVAWMSALALVLMPLAALFLLVDLEAFASLARHSLPLNIQWQTVEREQWYGLWLASALYAGIGLAGMFFLRRAFLNFAKGELFNPANSRDLRRFSALLGAQAIAQPVHTAVASVILSAGHPAGQKMLAFSFGSNELKMIGLGLVFWVVSDLLIEGSTLQSENQQFI